jgi:CheY-like chemotaxis protein
MNAIIGMAELVLGTELTVQQKEYLWTLKTSADSLLSLLNQILDLSKIEAGQLELDQVDFDLRSILKSATDMLSVRAKEAGLQLVSHIEPGVPVALVGDPLRLRQIVINLTDNAIKFTEEGQVAISVETQKEEDSYLLLHFAVSDTGVGIRADQTETIFESFKQAGVSATRRHPGTGLGLAICKQLVEMMGGKIWVDSEIGKGSVFHFTTRFQVNTVEQSEPLHATVIASGDITDERALHAIPEAPRRLNILVVEDNPVNQKVAAAMLEQLGHDVVLASSGRLAVQVLDKHEIDLILMDIQMPEMDGFEVTKLIRQREITNGGHIPIVAVTAHAMQGDRERCLAAGMDDYISKPIRSRSLSSVIQNLTNGSRGKKKESDPLLSDAVPVTQEIFDLSKAMGVVGGDKVLFEEVANVFLEDASEKVAKIREGVVRADASAVEKAAMTLKDSVVYFGAQRAFDAASRLELMGKNGTWTEVEAAQLELEKEIKTLEVAMRRAMAA